MSSKSKKVIYIIMAILGILIAFIFYKHRVKLGKIITPLILAVVISYLITPLVNKLESKKIPKKIGILLVYLGFLIVFSGIMIFIVPEITVNIMELMNTIPSMTQKYQDMFNDFISDIKSSNWPEEIKITLDNEIGNTILTIQNYITNLLKSILIGVLVTFTTIFDIFIAMVIAYHLTKDSEIFKASTFSLIPRKWRKEFEGLGRDVGQVISNFVKGQLTAAFIIGVLEIIGLMLLKVRYPLILGMLGGIANMIPYFGPLIGSIPAVAVALIDAPLKGVKTILMFIIVQQLDNVFISPKIIQGKLGIHPAITIIAILIGGKFFGILGMLLAVPITAILKVTLKRIINYLA